MRKIQFDGRNSKNLCQKVALLGFCCALPLIAAFYVSVKHKNSEILVEVGGFHSRSQAEKRSLEALWKTMQIDQSNLIWASYSLSVRLNNGLTGNRLASIGYDRKNETLIHQGTDPDLKTGFELPRRLERYFPVLPEDIEKLVTQQVYVSDIQKIRPNVRYANEFVLADASKLGR